MHVTKISSKESMESIFKSLGRLSLESHAKEFILELKTDGQGGQDLSNLVYSYAISIPKIMIEDISMKFKQLQAELKVASSFVPYEKLIKTCCDSLEVHLAIDLVESVSAEGLNMGIDTFSSILTACDTRREYWLVDRIRKLINDHNILNAQIMTKMISLCVKMKNYDGAYSMIRDLKKLNLVPTAHMYNLIMAGYFHQKKFHEGLMVLKQMHKSNVKPDSHTFSYLIQNCNSEDDIIKYHRELLESGVQPTKHIFMALINAYAGCGLYHKAKQVLLDERIAFINLDEIKSELVFALASNGQVPDALKIYDEMKRIEAKVNTKSTMNLIEHLQSEGELGRLLDLLQELHGTDLWRRGCAKIVLYCVSYKLLGPAVDLIKQRVEESSKSERDIDDLLNEVFVHIVDTEPCDMQFGLDLLKTIKEDIGIRIPRMSLDFLLSTCASARGLEGSLAVWKEFQMAGLPFNALSFVRMYWALLVCGDYEAAEIHLKDMPHVECPHVFQVLEEMRTECGVVESNGKMAVRSPRLYRLHTEK